MLDRAAEVKRKSYRESLEQNRDAVLLSKELVTIDCHVPLPLDLNAMETQAPDIEACRTLFTELEFTSMLRELAPVDDCAVSRADRRTHRRADRHVLRRRTQEWLCVCARCCRSLLEEEYR